MVVYKISPNKLTKKELGYLLGLFIGDGYKNYNKKNRHHIIDFYLNSEKDKDIIEYISILLIKLNLKPHHYKDKRCNVMRVRVDSKQLFYFIDDLSKQITKRVNRDFDIGLISGFIDAEGYVGNGEIQLAQKEYATLKQIKDICDYHNFKTCKFWSAKNYNSNNDIWRLRISTSFKSVPHNSIKIAR